nr:DUF1284 domain-containing protein [Nitratireductor basaltis]
MTIRLRPHHLLCTLTYVGHGYSREFIRNMDTTIARLNEGEPVLIVEGPDDICAPLLSHDKPHCMRESVLERDRAAAHSLSRALNLNIEPGRQARLNHRMIHRLRDNFQAGRTRKACLGCQWIRLCTEVANTDFSTSFLTGKAPD